MRSRTSYPWLKTGLPLHVLEEMLYDLPPLEGVFLHWQRYGASSMTQGIASLFSRRQQLLGSATLPGASIQLLAQVASACLHALPGGGLQGAWETRPLHARLLRHAPCQHAAEKAARLPPGVLAHRSEALVLGESLALCTGAGTRSLSRQERRLITAMLGLPMRESKRPALHPAASMPGDSEAFDVSQGLLSPFLPPQRQTAFNALVLLPWPRWCEVQACEVALSLSLWESLLLPLGSLRPLLRNYAAHAFPWVRVLDLYRPEEADEAFAQTGLLSCLRASVYPRAAPAGLVRSGESDRETEREIKRFRQR
jgi:hypothetical protein